MYGDIRVRKAICEAKMSLFYNLADVVLRNAK